MKTFQDRITDWKQLIIDGMVTAVNNDKMLRQEQKDQAIEKIKGDLGNIIAENRIAKALGINVTQLNKRLNAVHVPRIRKPKVIR